MAPKAFPVMGDGDGGGLPPPQHQPSPGKDDRKKRGKGLGKDGGQQPPQHQPAPGGKGAGKDTTPPKTEPPLKHLPCWNFCSRR